MDSEIWITSDGRAYLVTLEDASVPGPTENHFSKVNYFVILLLVDINFCTRMKALVMKTSLDGLAPASTISQRRNGSKSSAVSIPTLTPRAYQNPIWTPIEGPVSPSTINFRLLPSEHMLVQYIILISRQRQEWYRSHRRLRYQIHSTSKQVKLRCWNGVQMGTSLPWGGRTGGAFLALVGSAWLLALGSMKLLTRKSM